MAAAVFLCDGAQMPPRWQGETDRPAQHLSHSGLDPEVNLRIENLSHVLLGSIDGRAADLVKIASYAYSADQSVSRGGEADVYGRKWHRQMRLAIPVSDPRFWQRRSTSTALQVTLGFVSDDAWEFHFTKAKAAQSQLLLGLPQGRDSQRSRLRRSLLGRRRQPERGGGSDRIRPATAPRQSSHVARDRLPSPSARARAPTALSQVELA